MNIEWTNADALSCEQTTKIRYDGGNSMEQFTVREYIVREMGFPGVLKQEIVDEIVRCKDCKHSIDDKLFGGLWCQHPTEQHCERNADFYCGNGERRDDDRNG